LQIVVHPSDSHPNESQTHDLLILSTTF